MFDAAFLKKLEHLRVISMRSFVGARPCGPAGAQTRERARVRRPSPVRARRRCPAHRLESVQAPEPAAAEIVRRGTGPADLLVPRCEPIDGCRRQIRSSQATGRGALLYRSRPLRSRDHPAVSRDARRARSRPDAAAAVSSRCSRVLEGLEAGGGTDLKQSIRQFAGRPFVAAWRS